MRTTYSQEEITAAQQFEATMVPLGFIPTDEQWERVMDRVGDAPVTFQSLAAAAKALTAEGKLKWRSQAELDYQKLYDALTLQQQAAWEGWWFKQTSLLREGPNDEGYKNSIQVLEWSKGKEFTPRTFDLAVSNLARTSRRPIHWTPSQLPTYKDGPIGRKSHAGEKFVPPSTSTPNSPVKTVLHNHAKDKSPEPTPKDTLDANEARWRQMAEGLRTNIHSQDAALAQIRGSNWRQTYELRQKFIQGNSRPVPAR